MNPLALIPWRVWAGIALAFALFVAVGLFAGHERAVGAAKVQVKWDAERAALQAQLAAQQQRNVELQRQAELRYTIAADARARVITRTLTEVRNATVSLAACPVRADARRLLNDAARCASADSPAACGAGDGVRPPQ